MAQEAPGSEILKFERLLRDLSATFIRVPAERLDAEIMRALRCVVEFLGIERSTFCEFAPDGSTLAPTHSYASPGVDPYLAHDLRREAPWYHARVVRGETLAFERLPDDLPEEATHEREYMVRAGIKSHLSVPVAVGDSFVCAIVLASFRSHRAWPPDLTHRIRLVAEILANALHRKRAVEALRGAQELARSVLASFSHLVAVLDRDGQIISVNEAWERWVREAGSVIGPGAAYREACQVALADPDSAADMLSGIQSVLDGTVERFERTYRRLAPLGPRWFLTAVTALRSSVGGAVVSHTEVTELEQARAALRESLGEIQRLKDRLEAENLYLQEEIRNTHGFEEVVGESAALRSVLRMVEQVASTDATVLLLGETGTGKGLIAHAIHARSPRHDRALLTVNCAALPATLVESELFGHEKGAFTGATSARAGRFELADGGTLFLDEIGDLNPELQSKLLRVLQEGEFERLGSTRTRKVDVRVIASTNLDLAQAMSAGRFRPDLFYRLNVFPLHLPPLRARREDIPLLVWYFIGRSAPRLGRRITQVPRATMEALTTYPWPGNIRELQNVVERAIILSRGPTLTLDESFRVQPAGLGGDDQNAERLADVERFHIQRVLEQCSWRINGRGNAAERLHLHPNTLRFRMKKLGIHRPEAPPAPRMGRS